MIKVTSHIDNYPSKNYESIADAAKDMHVDESTIRKVLGTDKKVKSMTWKKTVLEEELISTKKSVFNRLFLGAVGVIAIAFSSFLGYQQFNEPSFVICVGGFFIGSGLLYVALYKNK
jgi:hypothetical protein